MGGDAPQPTYAVALISDTLSDTAEKTGIGRYDRRLRGGLSEVGLRVVQDAPKTPALPSVGYRLLRVLRRNKYPIWSSYPDADIYHLTSQDLASLLVLRRPRGRRCRDRPRHLRVHAATPTGSSFLRAR